MEKRARRPENMPRQVKAEKPKLKKEQGGEALPPQQPLTDEEALPKKTPRWKKIVRRVLAWVAVALALALCLFTSGSDGLLLPLALASAAAANVTDRCAEKKSQEGDYHE